MRNPPCSAWNGRQYHNGADCALFSIRDKQVREVKLEIPVFNEIALKHRPSGCSLSNHMALTASWLRGGGFVILQSGSFLHNDGTPNGDEDSFVVAATWPVKEGRVGPPVVEVQGGKEPAGGAAPKSGEKREAAPSGKTAAPAGNAAMRLLFKHS